MQNLSIVVLTLTLSAVGFTQQLPREEDELNVEEVRATGIVEAVIEQITGFIFQVIGTRWRDLTDSQVEEVRATGIVEAVIAAATEQITGFIFQVIGTRWRDTTICGTTCQIKYQTQICKWQWTYKTHIPCSGISYHNANCFKNKRSSVREATARTVRNLIAAGKTCTQG
ncbi:hypothetical protein BV898_06245 [Hypsibius exemplaris]|uniref:Uncharacterized protein n=1 Tax=Hypsibius exemplaris TaxID=2072580 RepID=A0A1W0WWX5_HYPEX|nr:hypothetical protein BV898_06245 [Hypsibius exemplaris]